MRYRLNNKQLEKIKCDTEDLKNRSYKTEKYNNEIKNSIDRFNATEKKINKLEDRAEESSQNEE